MIKKLFLTLMLGASVAQAQWLMPARQTAVTTSDFQWVPTTKTNAQLVFDWLDDTVGIRYTNTFSYLPSITTNVFGLWPFMTNVDNALATQWTNNFNRLPDVTTNLFGLWPFLTNVDTALSVDSNNIATLTTGKLDSIVFNQIYTNDFNVLPDITTNIGGLWPFMTNVDARLVALSTTTVSSVDAQPYVSFIYATDLTNSITGAQDVSTAWVAVTTNQGMGYRRDVATNGFTHVLSGTDNYFVVPSNGLYTLHNSMAYWMYNQGSMDSWITANGVLGAAASNGATRTFHQDYQNYTGIVATNLPIFHKHSGSAIFYWTAGTTVRVEAATAFAANSAKVVYVSLDIRRLGNP